MKMKTFLTTENAENTERERSAGLRHVASFFALFAFFAVKFP